MEQLKTSIAELKVNLGKTSADKSTLEKQHQELSSNYNAQLKEMGDIKNEKLLMISERDDLKEKHSATVSKVKILEVKDVENKSRIDELNKLQEKVCEKLII